MSKNINPIEKHQAELRKCQQCPDMLGNPVIGFPVASEILLIGQAPGVKELEIHKPFAWTAGKTLFKWFNSIGLDEEDFRKKVYMSAVCRCFPGKKPKGGDRVPNEKEISNCSQWLQTEIKLISPKLILPVGKLAISQFLDFKKLAEVIGEKHKIEINHQKTELIPLPHPSGASTWHQRDPGKKLLQQSLSLISKHTAWKNLLK